LIQSKLRKGGGGDHDFYQKDLQQQIDYTIEKCDNEDWIMIIRIDSNFIAQIPKDQESKIIVFDNSNNDQFYTPVINHTRKTSILQMLGEAWEITSKQEKETFKNDPDPVTIKKKVVLNLKRFRENYENIERSKEEERISKIRIVLPKTNKK